VLRRLISSSSSSSSTVARGALSIHAGERYRGRAPSICVGEASNAGADPQIRTMATQFPSSDGGGVVPKLGRRQVSTPTLAPPQSGGGGGSPLICWRRMRTRWPWRCCAARSPLPHTPLGPAAGAMVSCSPPASCGPFPLPLLPGGTAGVNYHREYARQGGHAAGGRTFLGAGFLLCVALKGAICI
jgi:hypothetical protein